MTRVGERPIQRAQSVDVEPIKLDESPVVVPRSDVDGAQQPQLHGQLASGADIANKRGPAPGIPMSTAVALRTAQSGVAALAKRFDEIERMVADGKIVRCVFDLDNTLFDTRDRTLRAGQIFDELNGTSYFKDVAASAMEEDGRKTAIKMGLPDDVVEAIGKVWDREFWNPDNLVHDGIMGPMIEIVREAQKRGAEVLFLTGRTEQFLDENGVERGFRKATLAQLERAGLEVASEQVLLKPGTHERTAPFKERELRRLAAGDDVEIGFFMTEGRRDIAHVRDTFPAVRCFLLDSSFEAGGPSLLGVPVLPRLM